MFLFNNENNSVVQGFNLRLIVFPRTDSDFPEADFQ